MTLAYRVGIIQMPSESEASWRRTLTQAAGQGGWKTFGSDDPALSGLTESESALIFIKSSAPLACGELSDCIVFDFPMAESVAVANARRPDLPFHGVQIVSARLLASTVLGKAATHVEAAGTRVEIPGLGTVERRGSYESLKAAPQVPALAIYDNGPPRIGASAVWTPEVMSLAPHAVLPDGSVRFDLTGKTRALVHGPYIELPSGRWRITVRFEAQPDDICFLLFDWGVGEDVVRCSTTIARQGRYEIALENERAVPGPWEIRIWAERGHFSGAINFIESKVELVG